MCGSGSRLNHLLSDRRSVGHYELMDPAPKGVDGAGIHSIHQKMIVELTPQLTTSTTIPDHLSVASWNVEHFGRTSSINSLRDPRHAELSAHRFLAARAPRQFGTLRSCSLATYYWLMTGVENVLAILRANMSTFESLGVRRLGVFGSTVTGEAGPDSDLDILVEFDPGRKSFDGYMDLKFLLEELFPDKRIDLVPENVLKPAIRPHVERTIRYVA